MKFRHVLRSAKRFLMSRRIFRKLQHQPIEEVLLDSERIYVRPASPDIDVARSCFNGEFESAIGAAKPLRFGLIVDAGGYIGTAAIVFAKAFPSATVLTLEPSIENFAILKKNVGPFSNIIALNKALSPENGRVRLVDRWTGQWGFSTYDVSGIDCPDPVLRHTAEGVTISALLNRFGKEGIDILKLDIEGAELEVFKGSQQWIDRTRVITVELHDRFRAGCEAAFIEATRGRHNSTGTGEKVLSVAPLSPARQNV